MSKYNLEEIHNNNLKEAMSADDQARFDQLTKDDQLKLEKIFAMMKAEKDAKKSTNEDFDSVVDKIKDSGKSEEDAKKIAGAINAKYVGNYREGVEENGAINDYTEEIAEENDEDKLPMDEARIDRDVAERIEGMLSIPLKRKFLDSFMDLWQDLIEEDPFYAEDVINHLNNEMHKEIDGYQAVGDKLAGMEEGAMQPGEGDLESGETGNMDALTEDMGVDYDGMFAYLDLIRRADKDYMDKEYVMTEFGVDSGEARQVLNAYQKQLNIEDEPVTEDSIKKDLVKEEGAPTGIAITDKQLDSLKKLGAIAGLEVYVRDKDGSNVRKVDYTLTNTDFEKDSDDIDDAGLREHFGRFMKDYQ